MSKELAMLRLRRATMARCPALQPQNQFFVDVADLESAHVAIPNDTNAVIALILWALGQA